MVGFFAGSMSTFGGKRRVLYKKNKEKHTKKAMKFGHFESPGMCVLNGFDIYCIYIYLYIYIYAIAQKRIATDGF